MNKSIVAVLLYLGVPFHAFAQRTLTVEEALSIAVQKNFDVRIEQTNAAGALVNKQFSIGAFLPQLNGVGTRTFNNNDQKQTLANGSEVERNGVESNAMTGSVQMVWTIFDGTRMFATRQRLVELAELGEVNLRNQLMNTSALVINNYFNIVRQKQQLKATQELISLSEERVKVADRKLQVGTGSKPEVLQARVDLNAQRTTALQQETLIAQLKDQLNGLLGFEIKDQYETADSIPLNLSLSFEEIIADIENTNLALIAARKNMGITEVQLKEARRSRMPTLSLTSAYNFTRNENKVVINSFTPLFNRNQGYNYGATINLPILNGLNTQRTIRTAQINLERQKLVYEQQLMVATIGVRNAFANYDNARKVLLIEEENILLAKENANIALESFKRGISNFIELRTAQQSLSDAYNRLIAARFNAKTSETELLRLKGRLLK